jgi:hypothetical protein
VGIERDGRRCECRDPRVYTSGEKLLVIGPIISGTRSTRPPWLPTPKGAAYTALQNPIQWVDYVVAFDGAGAAVPQLVTAPGGAITVGTMHASAPKAKVGCVYGAYIVVGDGANVRFSFPNDRCMRGTRSPTSRWTTR